MSQLCEDGKIVDSGELRSNVYYISTVQHTCPSAQESRVQEHQKVPSVELNICATPTRLWLFYFIIEKGIMYLYDRNIKEPIWKL